MTATTGNAVRDTRRARLADARLYLCTDARRRQGDLPGFLDAVLGSGVDIVQLRDKGLEAREELETLAVLADACRRHGALLAVNDRADVAHAAGADVLHLGQGDLPVPAARAILGERRGDRAVLPRRFRGGRGGRRARRGLLLHRAGLAHPDQAGPARAGPAAWSSTRPDWARHARGSPSAGSTRATSARSSPPAPAGSSSYGRSPRRPIRAGPPPACRDRPRGG